MDGGLETVKPRTKVNGISKRSLQDVCNVSRTGFGPVVKGSGGGGVDLPPDRRKGSDGEPGKSHRSHRAGFGW